MTPRIHRSLLLVAALLPPAAGSQSPAPSGRARVVGSVVDSATLRPIVRTQICAEIPDGAYGRRRCATPDTSGRYVLDSLPVGRRVVTFNCTVRSSYYGRLLRADTLNLQNDAIARIDVRVAAEDCDMQPFIQRHGVFAGHWTSGFEESRFIACGDTVSGWLDFRPGAVEKEMKWPEQNDRSYPTYFVRFEGVFRGPWHYGHMGVSRYEYDGERLLEVRAANPANCP